MFDILWLTLSVVGWVVIFGVVWICVIAAVNFLSGPGDDTVTEISDGDKALDLDDIGTTTSE